MNSKLKLCITYICTGKYNIFFKDFYESFKDNFCKEHDVTCAIITDSPHLYNQYKDCVVYNVQRYYNNDINYIKFRKFRDILIAEDYLETQNYCFYINGNLRCNNKVTLDELMGGKDQYAVYHSLFDIHTMPMYESLTENRASAAYFTANDRNLYPNYKYYQAGNFGASKHKFLQMCRFIESARNFDLYYGYDRYIKWHDETYYNKYINTLTKKNCDAINILDGKKYLCTWLPQLKPYVKSSKMILVNKDQEWQTQK